MEGHETKRPRTNAATAENLKRLARMLDSGSRLNLRINGRRVTLPADASLSLDLDRDPSTGCVEVDIRWSTSSLASERRGSVGEGQAVGLKRRERIDTERCDVVLGPRIRLKALVTAPTI